MIDPTGSTSRRVATVLLAVLAIGSMPIGGEAGAAGDVTRVALVYSTEESRVAEVAVAVDDALAAACSGDCRATIRLSSHATDGNAIAAAARVSDLVVTLGSGAALQVAKAQIATPTLYAFLPQAAWDDLARCCARAADERHAVLIDQPLTRQFALLRTLLPDASRVAVLLGPASRAREAELRQTAAALGYTLQVGQIGGDNDVGSTLRRVLPDADALLALPDPAVYNRNTIYAILLTTYAAGVPVVGYSQAMVTAGATAAVFASTTDVGTAIAGRIARFRDSRRLQPTGFGDVYSVAVNAEVARSLRLAAPGEDELRRRLEQAR